MTQQCAVYFQPRVLIIFKTYGDYNNQASIYQANKILIKNANKRQGAIVSCQNLHGFIFCP